MGSGIYSWITFQQARQALAQQLDDPQNIHWQDAELGMYLNEALTEWQALTGYSRARGAFNLSPGIPFYDITTLLKGGAGNLLLTMGVTDAEVITLMEYMLLEPPTIPWTGTTQFTLTELTAALQQARDNFLVETGSVITHSTVNVPSPPLGRFQLDDHIIDVRRAAWLALNPPALIPLSVFGTHVFLNAASPPPGSSFTLPWTVQQGDLIFVSLQGTLGNLGLTDNLGQAWQVLATTSTYTAWFAEGCKPGTETLTLSTDIGNLEGQLTVVLLRGMQAFGSFDTSNFVFVTDEYAKSAQVTTTNAKDVIIADAGGGYYPFNPPEITAGPESTLIDLYNDSNYFVTHLSEYQTTKAAGTFASSIVPAPGLPDANSTLYLIVAFKRGYYSPVTPTPLWMTDEFASQTNQPGWQQAPGVPESISIVAPPPLQAQLIPAPAANGSVDLLTVNVGAALDPAVGVALGIPTNFAWAVKWGALANLLSQDGEPKDGFRANYCRQRYEEACELCRMMPVVVTAALTGVGLFLQTVGEFDAYRPTWEFTNGPPDAIGTCGQNMIAVAPPPDSTPVSVMMDVVQNAVVPVNDGDFVQIGREFWKSILNEAQHLACFKSGGQEFADTGPLHQDFIRAAATCNDRLKAMSIYLSVIQSQSDEEKKIRPRRETDATEETT